MVKRTRRVVDSTLWMREDSAGRPGVVSTAGWVRGFGGSIGWGGSMKAARWRVSMSPFPRAVGREVFSS